MQEIGLLVAEKVDKNLAPHLLGEGDFDCGLCELTRLVIVGRGLLHLLPNEILSCGNESIDTAITA